MSHVIYAVISIFLLDTFSPWTRETSNADIYFHRALDVQNISANVPIQYKMTNELVASLEALTPGGGAYLNEADFRQPDFQDVFYGGNYDALEAIKNKYDPYDLFYATTAVGSEKWTSEADGRLCRA